MALWDKLCGYLNAKCISVEDVSNKVTTPFPTHTPGTVSSQPWSYSCQPVDQMQMQPDMRSRLALHSNSYNRPSRAEAAAVLHSSTSMQAALRPSLNNPHSRATHVTLLSALLLHVAHRWAWS